MNRHPRQCCRHAHRCEKTPSWPNQRDKYTPIEVCLLRKVTYCLANELHAVVCSYLRRSLLPKLVVQDNKSRDRDGAYNSHSWQRNNGALRLFHLLPVCIILLLYKNSSPSRNIPVSRQSATRPRRAKYAENMCCGEYMLVAKAPFRQLKVSVYDSKGTLNRGKCGWCAAPKTVWCELPCHLRSANPTQCASLRV